MMYIIPEQTRYSVLTEKIINDLIYKKMEENATNPSPSIVLEEIFSKMAMSKLPVAGVFQDLFNELCIRDIPGADVFYTRVSKGGLYFTLDSIISVLHSNEYKYGKTLTIEWSSIPESLTEWYSVLINYKEILEIITRDLQEFFSPYINVQAVRSLKNTMKVEFQLSSIKK